MQSDWCDIHTSLTDPLNEPPVHNIPDAPTKRYFLQKNNSKTGPFRAHQISAPWCVVAPFLSLFIAGRCGVLRFPAFKTSFSPPRVTLPPRQFIQTVLCGSRNPLTRQNVSPDKKTWLNNGDGR